MSIEVYQSPVVVTVAYTVWYFVLITYGLTVRVRLFRACRDRGERFDRYFNQDRELLAADRMQLNMLEQMPVFLVGLWLHAFFVSPTSAGLAGWAYLASRVVYPFLLGKRLDNTIPFRIFYATMPGYGVLVYLFGGLIWALIG